MTETLSEKDLRHRLDGLFEALLGSSYENPDHPARLYTESLSPSGRPHPIPLGESSWAAAVTSAILDTATWARFDPAKLWNVMGGDEVRRILQPRLQDPVQYLDALAEVRLWGQIFGMSGLTPRFATEDGQPDLHLTDDGEAVWIEAKRVRPGSADRALADAVGKANRQIRKATNQKGAGTVHISIGEPRPWEPRSDPSEKSIDTLQKQLLIPGRYRSVAHAVVSWDDYVLIVGSSNTVVLFPRRRSRSVIHPEPRVTSKLPKEWLTIGAVSPFSLTPAPADLERFPLHPRQHGSIVELLRHLPIDWGHVLEALATAVWETYEIGEVTVGLCLGHFDVGIKPQVPILIGGVVTGQELEVRFAYPLRKNGKRRTPLPSLLDFCGRYGLLQLVDDQYSQLVAAVHNPHGPGQELRFNTQDATARFTVHLGGPQLVPHAALAHSIDLARYQRDLVRRGFPRP